MNAQRLILLALTLSASSLLACSSDEDDGDGSTPSSAAGTASGAGGTGDGGAGGTASSTGGGGNDGATGSGGATGSSTGSGGDCASLAQELAAKLAQAQSCTGASNDECQGFVAGLCCDEVVTHKDAQATRDYLAALAAYQAGGCDVNCPPEPCANTNKGLCSAGTCIPFER